MKKKILLPILFSLLVFEGCKKETNENTTPTDDPGTITLVGTPPSHFGTEPLATKKIFGYDITVAGIEEHYTIASGALDAGAADTYRNFMSNINEDINLSPYYFSNSSKTSGSNSELDNKAFFFSEEGTFERYDIPSEAWDWGYWYVSETGSYISLETGYNVKVWWYLEDPNDLTSWVVRTSDESSEGIFIGFDPLYAGTDESGDWCASDDEFIEITQLLTSGSYKKWNFARWFRLDYNEEGVLEYTTNTWEYAEQLWFGSDGTYDRYYDIGFGLTFDYNAKWRYNPCNDLLNLENSYGNEFYYKIEVIGETTFTFTNNVPDNIRYLKYVYEKIDE